MDEPRQGGHLVCGLAGTLDGFARQLDDALVPGGELQGRCGLILRARIQRHGVGMEGQGPAPRPALGFRPEAPSIAGAVHAENDRLDLGVVGESLVC